MHKSGGQTQQISPELISSRLTQAQHDPSAPTLSLGLALCFTWSCMVGPQNCAVNPPGVLPLGRPLKVPPKQLHQTNICLTGHDRPLNLGFAAMGVNLPVQRGDLAQLDEDNPSLLFARFAAQE